VVIYKKGSSTRYAAATFLASQNIPVRLNDNHVTQRHKFIMIVDGKHVQTGSFSYNANAANRNVKNVLTLWNMPELAALYTTEWQLLWNKAEPLPAQC
jgi:hypothetical protein